MTLRSILRTARRRLRDEPQLRAAARRADSFLVSYPKSGRTWLRFLLSCYFAEVADLGFEPDLTTTFSVLPNFDRDPVRGIGAFVGGDSMPLILVSHLGHNPRLFADQPVIFLVRDPRDVIVSAYFHATRHKHVFTGNIGAFLDDRTYGPAALFRFLNGWAAGLKGVPHHVVSYEAVLADTEAAVIAILAFLGQTVHVPVLRRAITAAQFDRMRDRERGEGIPGHDYDRTDDLSLRMRSGKAGSFAEWLSADQAEAIVTRCRNELSPDARALLARTGLDLDGRDTYAPSLLTPA